MSDKTNKNGAVGKFKATSAVQIVSKEKKMITNVAQLQTVIIKLKIDPIYCLVRFHGTQQLKKSEILMKKGNGLFA